MIARLAETIPKVMLKISLSGTRTGLVTRPTRLILKQNSRMLDLISIYTTFWDDRSRILRSSYILKTD